MEEQEGDVAIDKFSYLDNTSPFISKMMDRPVKKQVPLSYYIYEPGCT